MIIDRCYCFQQTFEALRVAAEAHDVHSIEALQQHVTFGERCALCHPYVRRMLRTGETAFGAIITECDEPPAPPATESSSDKSGQSRE